MFRTSDQYHWAVGQLERAHALPFNNRSNQVRITLNYAPLSERGNVFAPQCRVVLKEAKMKTVMRG